MNYFNLGIAIGFFATSFLVLFRNRLSKDKQDCYDERQVIVRGKGYQYAFFTTMGLLMLYATFAEPIEKYLEAGIIPLAILLFSGLILMGYCLFHDAFWGLSSKKNKRMVVTVWALFSVLKSCISLIIALLIKCGLPEGSAAALCFLSFSVSFLPLP